MKSNLFFILLTVLALVVVSCKTSFESQVYDFQLIIDSNTYDENEIKELISESKMKTIVLKNDSVLEFRKRHGGLGSLITIEYTLVDNEIVIDSTDVTGRYIPELSDIHFLYSRDSLVNRQTNEKYYNQKFVKKTERKH
jgi:hypothetical protein